MDHEGPVTKIFLIGESYLAWRNSSSRGNVQKGLEDLGYTVENFAKNGVTLSNFWWKSNMSWDKWEQIQKQHAMVISIGFNQLSDSDMSAKDEAEVVNIVQQALARSNHVIMLVPNQPLLDYFTVRAEWYIGKQKDDLNDPDVTTNALKRQQLYAGRFQKLFRLLKATHDSHSTFRIVDMHGALEPDDICEDGCHLNHQGATKTATAIAQALKSPKQAARGKGPVCIWMALLAVVIIKLTRFHQKRMLRKLSRALLS
jgi:lysophospholipase L1-like esterase